MTREQRLVFGSVAEAYDERRPGYPDALFDFLLSRFERPPRVLDIGCGTGRVAVSLATRELEGLGIEPDPAMASVAERRLRGCAWTVHIGDFEDCDVDAGSIDLITCGQAWHWVDPDAGMAKALHVLRPGGWLALFWNRPEWTDAALRRALDACHESHAPDMRSSIGGRGNPPKGRPLSTDPPPGFDAARVDEFFHDVTYSTAGWIALLETHSDHVMLDAETTRALHASVAEVIDAAGGLMDVRYRTECWSGRRAS